MSKTFKEAKGKSVVGGKQRRDWKMAEPRDQMERGEWWTMFHDPELNILEERLNHCNQTIKTALANYMQARAIVDEARAAFMPTFSANASATRERTVNGSGSFSSSSQTGTTSAGTANIGRGSSSSGTTTHVSTQHSLIFTASWEPDIWGLVRRQVEASASAAQASAALLAATRLSAQSSLAQYYFELRGTEANQKLLNNTVAAYKKTLKLTENQYKSGVASRADIVQAQAQLEAAQALAINNGVLRAQYEHAIAVLIGLPPAVFTLPPSPLKAAPPPIPVELPSELLERRPDIAQAERLMQQANAQIGVAVAAYFPTLTLTGNASDSGTGLAHWFSLPMMAWSYGPQLSQLIYDGGLRNAQVRAAKAGYSASVASYRQVVLTAFQNVEDNLASLRILSNEMVVQNKAVASARQALKLVINQYKAGIVAYSSVITAQITAYTAEQNAVNINYQRMVAAVGLITALGGGWDESSIKCA